MERRPEPDLMDDEEQARAYADTDFSEAHDAFVSHFKSRFSDFITGEVLDLGCGTADVVIRFAKAFPDTHIKGVDGAKAMLNIGSHDIEQEGLSNRIKLEECLLPDNNLSSHKFDALISNSLLHHLDNPIILWDTVRKCSKQGAPIFIMDLLRPDSEDRARELVSIYAGDASPILQKDFYNSLLSAYRVEEVREQLKETGLDYLAIDVISDRHLLVWGTLK
jgi:ubiquinone/menaquinone biosynthesis C-methylase UbiE